MTGSGAPASPARTTSRRRSSARSGACRKCPTSSALSSPTPTCATSQHDQSPLTNELFSKRDACGLLVADNYHAAVPCGHPDLGLGLVCVAFATSLSLGQPCNLPTLGRAFSGTERS